MVLFSYSDISKIKTKYSLNKVNKVRLALDKIVATKSDFQQNGIIIFRKNRKIPGDNRTEILFQVITLYFPDTEPPESKSQFIEEFHKKYSLSITKEKNLLKIQTFKLGELIEVEYYDNDLKFEKDNPNAKTFYASIVERGLIFNTSKVASPAETEQSFRYNQMLLCHPEDPQIVKNKMTPDLAATYQPNDACIGATVNWNSTPEGNLLCSKSLKPFNYKIEKQIFAATLFKNCFAEGMSSIVQEIKNTGNDLTKNKLNDLTKQKYVKILEEVLESDYDKFVNPNSQFYKDFIFLKRGVKKYIMDLIGDAEEKAQTNDEVKSEANEAHLSSFDIENYSAKSNSKLESNSLDVSKNIQSDWKNLRQKYSAGYVKPAVVSVDPVSAGSVISEAKLSTAETSKQITSELKEKLSSSQLSYKETERLNEFIGKNNKFFEYLKKNKVKLDRSLIKDLTSMSDADVWKKYKSKIDNPYFDFIYEKRFGKKINNKQTNNKSENSWDNGNSKVEKLNNLIAAFKGSDKNKLKIEGINYNNSKYKDTNLFVKEKTKCASRKNKVTDADGNGVETYDEPPVNEDKELAGQNTTIAIPPTAPSPGSIKVDSPPDDSIDNIPHDAAQLVI